jgi:glutathione S-transferase
MFRFVNGLIALGTPTGKPITQSPDDRSAPVRNWKSEFGLNNSFINNAIMANLTLVIGNKNYSSWSLRPWLALKQFGLKFDEIRIPLYTPEASEKIRQYSPSGKVPTLLHGDVTVWDSLAILDYLIEQFPALSWLPKEPKPRAIARSISAEMHSGFVALRENMPMNIRACFPNKGLTPAVQKDIDRITAIWQECRQTHGDDGNFLFGEFTITDAMFAPVVLRFVTYGIQLNPVSRNYVEAILALPALQEWIEASKAEPETIPGYEF